MSKIYTGSLFGGQKQEKPKVNAEFYKSVDTEKLIKYQTELLMSKYNTACLDVKQLQEILNVGETNAYAILKNDNLPYRVIGRRKVVPVIALARYLVLGNAS